MTSEEFTTISSHGKLCVRSFERLRSIFEDGELPASCEGQISEQTVKDEFGRFRVWAGNIGALQRGQTSLDYRLREASHIRQPILKLLKDLDFSLRELISILSGERLPRDSESTDSNAFSDDEVFSEGSSADGESVAESEPAGGKTEIQYLLQSVIEAIGSLFKLSMIIRSATPRDRYAKAAKIPKYEDQYDVSHIWHKYPRVRDTEWLAEKLGKANAKRRQYLKYREKHREKLARDEDEKVEFGRHVEPIPNEKALLSIPAIRHNIDAESTRSRTSTRIAPTLAPTTASTFILPEIETVDETSDTGQSQTTYATSVSEEEAGELRVPPLPAEAHDECPFECPYCYTIQTVKGTHHWKKHVFSDLEPYICTFKDCFVKPFSTRHAWFEHEMTAHRKEWYCQSCRLVFSSPDVMRNHLKRKHDASVTDAQLPAVLEKCERPLDKIPASDCPLCDSWGTLLRDRMAQVDPDSTENIIVVTPKQFRNHLGRHLEQIALFALPRNIGDEDEEDEDFSSDVAQNIKGSDDDSSAAASAEVIDIPKPDFPSNDGAESPSQKRLSIHSAALGGKLDLVLKLLEDGTPVDSKDANGNTPLALAASNGHESVALLLLERGAQLDQKDVNGFTPLDLARIGRHESLLNLLLTEGNTDEKTNEMPEILSSMSVQDSVFNATSDAQRIYALLRDRVSLPRPDQQMIIEILPRLNAKEAAELDTEYRKISGNIVLAQHLWTKLPSGKLREFAWACAAGPYKTEARWASSFFMSDVRNPQLILESLLDKTNYEISQIRQSFECPKFLNDLQQAIIWDMKADSLRNGLLTAITPEQRMSDVEHSTEEEVMRDAGRLFEAFGLGINGGAEKALSDIFIRANAEHLQKVSKLYHEIYGSELQDIISEQFEGPFGAALSFVLQGAINRPLRDATLIYDALEGRSEIKERLLTVRLLRVHWDRLHLERVKKIYAEAYGRQLVGRLGHLLKGAFRDMVVEMYRS